MSDKMIQQQLKAARRVSVPLIAIVTPDPAQTVREVVAALDNGDAQFCSWDIVRGFAEPLIDRSYGTASVMGGEDAKLNPITLIDSLPRLPPGAIVFLHAADRLINDPSAGLMMAQGIWNLRDQYKVNRRTLIMLVRDARLPAELKDDVLVLDEPLPTLEQLGQIVGGLTKDAKKANGSFACDDDTRAAAAGRLTGLSAFAAEQAAAMSLLKSGFDLDAMWHRKRKLIEATPGLSVYAGQERFDAIGGCANVKRFLSRVINGKRKPRAVVFIDEIEKSLGGSQHDTSGVSQDQLRTLLTEMQDHSIRGTMFVGHGGTAKSAIAKAAGNESDGMTIQLDLGGSKGGIVGQSESQIREAFKVIRAVGGDDVIAIATCNKIADLPPELRRRFTLGTFFFDLPTEEERESIWSLYLSKHEIPKNRSKRPKDAGWTGAEIKACVENAYDQGVSLIEASEYITPIAISAPDRIASLRSMASGKFLSASHSGLYTYDPSRQISEGRMID